MSEDRTVLSLPGATFSGTRSQTPMTERGLQRRLDQANTNIKRLHDARGMERTTALLWGLGSALCLSGGIFLGSKVWGSVQNGLSLDPQRPNADQIARAEEECVSNLTWTHRAALLQAVRTSGSVASAPTVAAVKSCVPLQAPVVVDGDRGDEYFKALGYGAAAALTLLAAFGCAVQGCKRKKESADLTQTIQEWEKDANSYREQLSALNGNSVPWAAPQG